MTEVIPREEAMRNAGRVLAQARARIATLTPEEVAEAAYLPYGPSKEEIAARIRELREQTRRAGRAEPAA